MKTYLSISEDYCPKWGLWEGVREVVQNYLDARDDGFYGEVKYHPGSHLLSVRNDGARLTQTEISLLGSTSKADGGRRGMFGEGIKIGLLALVRAGYRVTIRSGDVFWKASIEASRQFNARVLVLDSRKNPHFDGVEVKITGILPGSWEDIASRFLDLAPRDDIIDTSSARVLTCEADRGRVFVRGIYVCDDESLRFGYDFKYASVDRDRRIVRSWDLDYYTAKAMVEMHEEGDVTDDEVLDLLESGKAESRSFEHHVDAPAFDRIEKAYAARYGSTAVPVETDSEIQELGHHGLEGRRAPHALVEVFKKFQRGAEGRANDEARKPAKTHSWDELDDVEQLVVLEVFNLLKASAVPFDQDKIAFVDFVDPRLLGQFEGGEIRISRRILLDRVALLITLVEELAHPKGRDGSMGHKKELHSIYGKIVGSLAKWEEGS